MLPMYTKFDGNKDWFVTSKYTIFIKLKLQSKLKPDIEMDKNSYIIFW